MLFKFIGITKYLRKIKMLFTSENIYLQISVLFNKSVIPAGKKE